MSKIPGSAHLNLSLGGLVITGGAYGYFRKGSKASLFAGLTFGTLLLGSGYLIASGGEFQGHALATGTSGLMGLGMAHRYLKTNKFMPAGLVATIGIAAAAYNGKKARDWAP
jgi:uncharacterized membrane protein (UPF0136 family)